MGNIVRTLLSVQQIPVVVSHTTPQLKHTSNRTPMAFLRWRRRIMAKAISKTKVFDGGASELFTYSLLKSGLEVNARDVEVPDSLALEVIVLWGSSVLHVSHSTPPRNFTLGESTGEQGTCDFFIPEEVLGATQFALVTTSEQSINILIPPGAKGFFEIPGELRMSLAEARRRGTPSMQVVGGFELPLPASSRASIQLSDFTFQVATVNAGKPSKRGLSAGVEGAVFSYFGLSLAAIGSLVTAMAFLVPPQGMTDDESFRDDQVYVIQQYLQASAERNRKPSPRIRLRMWMLTTKKVAQALAP